MNKHLLLPLLLPALFLFACKSDPAPSDSPAEAPNTVTLTSQSVEKKEGDCETEDFQSKCVEISLRYPVVTQGSDQLKASVSRWVNDFMIGILDPSLEPDQETALDQAILSFVEMHREMVMDMPDMPAYYTVEVTDTVLMHTDEYLTLRLDGYIYAGGAHPNSTAAVATFDPANGRIVGVEDLVEDLDSLKNVAEEAFRRVQKEAFEDGFEFTESWPFKIADNVGLTTEGLYFCYVPYEVTPYVMGFTEFTIPYEVRKE